MSKESFQNSTQKSSRPKSYSSKFETELPKILGVPEIAEYLNTSERSVYYMVKTNQIPFFRIGRRRIGTTEKMLREWMQEQTGLEYHINR